MFLLSLMLKNSEKQKTRISAFTHWMCLIHCFNFQLKSMWCWVTLHPSEIHWFSFLSPLGHSHIQNLDIKPFCFYFRSDIFWTNSNILMIFRLLFGPLPIPAITCLYYHYRHSPPPSPHYKYHSQEDCPYLYLYFHICIFIFMSWFFGFKGLWWWGWPAFWQQRPSLWLDSFSSLRWWLVSFSATSGRL